MKRNFAVNAVNQGFEDIMARRKSDIGTVNNNTLAPEIVGLHDSMTQRDTSPLPSIPNRLTPMITAPTVAKTKNLSKLDAPRYTDAGSKLDSQLKIATQMTTNINDKKTREMFK